MGLFIKKPFAALQAEANESGNKTLKRVLGPWSLIALGVGVIIGAGLFSITGTVAAGYTGPAITLSFAIAAIGCCFAGYATAAAKRSREVRELLGIKEDEECFSAMCFGYKTIRAQRIPTRRLVEFKTV